MRPWWGLALLLVLAVPAGAHEGVIVFEAADGPYAQDRPIPLDDLGLHVVELRLTDGNGTPLDGLDVRLAATEVLADGHLDEPLPAWQDVAPMDARGDGWYRQAVDFGALAEGNDVTVVLTAIVWDGGPTDDFAQIPYRYQDDRDAPAPAVGVLGVVLGAALMLRRCASTGA